VQRQQENAGTAENIYEINIANKISRITALTAHPTAIFPTLRTSRIGRDADQKPAKYSRKYPDFHPQPPR
jgi:hypothetical protein